jgi:hypothetical protein
MNSPKTRLHHRRCDRVWFEAVQPLTDCSLRWVRVRHRVGEDVSVRWPAAEETALDCGLCSHRGSDASLDPVALTLAHASVEAHYQVVRVGTGIDRSADLGHPQLDVVVDEDGEGEPELVAVERALRLSNDNSVPPAARVSERVEETRGLGPALPRQRSRWPTSKYSATISPAACSMTWRERASCQLRDEAGSCWSSVLTRP